MEVGRFWRFTSGRPSWGAVGFFLNRYLSILGHVPVILEFFGSEVYSVSAKASQRGCFSALQISRVYALYNGSRKVLRIFLGLSVVFFAVSGVRWSVCPHLRRADLVVQWATSETWRTHCSSLDDGSDLAVVWGCVLVFDIAIFGSTLHRVLQVRERWSGGLFTIMLRDGAVYFGVLLVCHLANILVCMLAEPAYRDPSVTITTVIATTLIARLMLNIRDPELRTMHLRLTSDDYSEV
ncbi:hypothetical protein C8T65DRAFT_815104 [Cerioporus squamosus]|nr:hypothetical protein C8T65DRAFT_815104 [Cerioporus squamosus]